MLVPGTYRWDSDRPGIWGGYVRVNVKETAASFILTLVENTCRFNAPQIDDLFRKNKRVVIRKDGSNHALSFIDGFNDWFCLYPYRIGVPYGFRKEN